MKRKLILLLIVCVYGLSTTANALEIDWSSDLDVYHQTLEEKHIDLYKNISKEKFIEKLNKIREESAKLTDFQIKIELMRLTREIGGGQGDGHTSIPLWETVYHRYPVEVMNFDGEIRIIRAHKNHANLLGTKILKIDDVPIERIINEVSSIVPFTENKFSRMARTSSYFLISEILYSLDLTKKISEAKFTVQDDKNVSRTTTLKAILDANINKSNFQEYELSIPKASNLNTSKLDGLWFSMIPEKKTVYIKFSHYTSQENMDLFSKNLIESIIETDSKNIIIDIRDNYGGDFFVGLKLAFYLNLVDIIDWQNGVYVLTNRRTFSAAMVNSAQFRQLLNAKLVGEPTGGNPNGPQDMGTFNLPSSDLLVSYSKRIFKLQETSTEGVQPDVFVSYSWEDYKNGVDGILNHTLQIFE